MKIVIAPDSFKGTMSASRVCAIVSDEIARLWPAAEVISLPLSDGGEGALSLLSQHAKGTLVAVDTVDALLRPITASYFKFQDEPTAWIELSQAVGLAMLQPHERNPLHTSTYGAGTLIKHALDAGCNKIILGLGGSATNDLGLGIFQALGGLLLDEHNQTLPPAAQHLDNLFALDMQPFQETWGSTRLILAVDVQNPLLGKTGATYTYGKQKGGTDIQLEQLEHALARAAALIEKTTGKPITEIAGGGAAGGAAAGLYGLANGSIESGFDLAADIVQLDQHLHGANMVITAEGYVDPQTAYGKLPVKVAERARHHNIPVICLTGGAKGISDALYTCGITAVFPIIQEPLGLPEALNHAEQWLRQTAHNIVKLCKAMQHDI